MMSILDRYQGCMVGLATGDALGTTLEFKSPGSFDPIDDIVGGGPFNLEPGQWTDDTSMALCLAESLIEKKLFDPVDQLERYVRWYTKGYHSSTHNCFDIGNTIRFALDEFQQSRKPYCGLTDKKKSGNGSIMRLAPVPLFFACDPEAAIQMSGTSSRTTHGSILAIDACRYMGSLISGMAMGIKKDVILSSTYEPVPNYWEKNPLAGKIEDIRQGSFKTREPPQIKGDGFVARSLEAALWAFYKSSSFQQGCLMAVNLGDDADTTGAVYGQIAGVYYGLGGIPNRWISKIAQLDLIKSFAMQLFEISQVDHA